MGGLCTASADFSRKTQLMCHGYPGSGWVLFIQ